jgi:hypothetical protein
MKFPLHQIPNKATGRRALLAQRVELGFHGPRDLYQYSNHLHGVTSIVITMIC